MHPAFSSIDHRPWPLPAGPWVGRQSWCDLLFLHWRIDARALRPLVPPGLTIQQFDGSSWIGVVPFHMAGVSSRLLPDIPGISAFPELNLRLYVERDGKPGVWFLSLDATKRLAVWGGRSLFHLPYFLAQISIQKVGADIHYTCRRHKAPVGFRATYRPNSEVYHAPAGSLEHFLTERYCLYAQARDGRLLRVDVHHGPWPLQSATAEVHENTLLSPHGLECEGKPALLHFSRRLDVVVWAPTRVTP